MTTDISDIIWIFFDICRPFFLHRSQDYFALLPAAYYEGTILQERATEPCYLGQEQPLCLLYAYPDLSWAAGAAAAEGFNADGGTTQLHDDQQVRRRMVVVGWDGMMQNETERDGTDWAGKRWDVTGRKIIRWEDA